MDIAHILFGGMGGQVNVASQLAGAMARVGLSSGALLYAPLGDHLPVTELSGVFDDICVVNKRRRMDASGASRIGRQVRHWRPRAVVWHSPYAPVALARARLALATESLVLVEHQSLARRSRGNDARSLAGLAVADAVVFLTEDYQRRYRFARHPLRALRRQAVVPSGLDLGLYESRAADTRTGPLRVGMLGRMIAGKDFIALLGAWQLVVRARSSNPPLLRLAGDGPERGQIEATVEALGLSEYVEVLGRLAEQEVPEFLSHLDIYVHASQGETLSTSLLQAYAAGLPVIASRVSGIDTFIDDDVDGLVVDTDQSGAFATSILRLLDDWDLRARLGAAARRRAERNFTVERTAAGYLALLARLDPDGPWAAANAMIKRGVVGPPHSGT